MWRRAGRTKSMRDWKPMCRGCGYDLSGLSDGACPECGRRFTLLALRMAAEIEADTRRTHWIARARVAGALFWVTILISFGHLPPSVVIQASRHDAWIQQVDAVNEAVLITLAWLAGLAWMVAARVSGRSGRLVLIVLPLLVPRTVASVFLVSSWDRVLVAPWLVVAAWVVALLPRGERQRVAGLTLGLVAAVMMLMGGLVLISPPQSPGSPWSIWRDPRPGQEHDQFPLTVRESRWLGGGLVAVAMAMLGWLAWCVLRAWVRRDAARLADATAERGNAKLADAAAGDG